MGKEALTAFALSGARGACVDLSIEGGNHSIAHIKEHIASKPSAPSSYVPEVRTYTSVDLSLEGGNDSIAHLKEHISSKASVPSSYDPELRAYACDVTSEAKVAETWKQIIKDFGKVDVVLTSAGIVENFEAEHYPYDKWKKVLDINLNGSFLFAREAGKYWIDQKSNGNLILVSSMSATICVRPQKQAAYNAVSYSSLPLLVK